MQNEAALATALLVAETIGAEICGFFMEEPELIEHAGVTLRLQSGSSDTGSAMIPVTHEAMRAALKRETVRWRERLSVEAERRNLKWSFNVKPERSGDWLLQEVGRRDLLILIRDSISESLFSRARQFIEFADQVPSMIVGTGSFATAADAPMAVILEEGISEESAVRTALALMGERRGALHLIVITDRPDLTNHNPNRIFPDMDRQKRPVVIHSVASGSVAGVVRLINTFKPALTIADRRQSLFQDKAMASSLVRSAASPFLLLGRVENLSPSKEVTQ